MIDMTQSSGDGYSKQEMDEILRNIESGGYPNLETKFNTKVDKVAGKQLSQENYTTAEKASLASMKEQLENLDVTYTNLNPIPINIGGVKAGTVFNNTPISDVFDKVFYPYQDPSFSLFRINGVDTAILEVGEAYPAGSKTFTWAIANDSNLKPNTINCNGVANLANTGTNTQTIAEIKKTTNTNHVFTITAKNSNDVSFSRSITLNWRYRRFFGALAKEELLDADILAMDSELATNRTKTLEYDCEGGKYVYYAYPSVFGDLSGTKVGPLDWNDYILVKRAVINSYGVSIPYNIYRSTNSYFGKPVVAWN